jgi:hemerythrin-like domain-containing protein
MDALELLKLEHAKIAGLFGMIKTEQDNHKKRRLFQTLRSRLDDYSHLVESVFYPAFLKYDETRPIVEDLKREHERIHRLLAGLNGFPSAPGAEARFEELINQITVHVDREEKQFFPMVRKLMKRNEREHLGRLLQAAKDERAAAA